MNRGSTSFLDSSPIEGTHECKIRKKKKKINRGGRKTYNVDQIATTRNSSLRESSCILEHEF